MFWLFLFFRCFLAFFVSCYVLLALLTIQLYDGGGRMHFVQVMIIKGVLNDFFCYFTALSNKFGSDILSRKIYKLTCFQLSALEK